jgi:hypothetical protein
VIYAVNPDGSMGQEIGIVGHSCTARPTVDGRYSPKLCGSLDHVSEYEGICGNEHATRSWICQGCSSEPNWCVSCYESQGVFVRVELRPVAVTGRVVPPSVARRRARQEGKAENIDGYCISWNVAGDGEDWFRG